MARMEEGRIARGAMFGRPEGRRPPGRPRMRWEDNVKRDVEQFGMEAPDHWHDVALNRREWGRLVKAAKDHMGPEPME